MSQRPSDDYRNAITDPDEFIGRATLLEQIRLSPRIFRLLLGGRRIGKTSLLRAIEWRLLTPDLRTPRRAFPVFLTLQREQPRSLGHFRYQLIVRLRQAITRWQGRAYLMRCKRTERSSITSPKSKLAWTTWRISK